MRDQDEIERPGEREATERAQQTMATNLESVRTLLLGGVVLLALLGFPVILAALVSGP